MTDEEISTKLIRMGYRKKMMRSSIERGLVYAYYEHPARSESFSFWGKDGWEMLSIGVGLVPMTRKMMEEQIKRMKETK